MQSVHAVTSWESSEFVQLQQITSRFALHRSGDCGSPNVEVFLLPRQRIQVVHVCSADRVATLDDTDADAPSLQSLSQLSDDTSGADSDSELSVVVNSISVDFSESFFQFSGDGVLYVCMCVCVCVCVRVRVRVRVCLAMG